MAISAESHPTLSQLETRLYNTKAQLHDLATMGAIITSIHEIEAVLSVVMDMSLRLVTAEVGLIVLNDKGDLKPSICWGLSDGFAHSLRYRDDKDLLTWVFDKREAVILNELGLVDGSGVHVQSLVCLPIQTSDNIHGVLLIVNKADGGCFADEDREILEMLANFAAVAIDNSNLVEDRLRRQEQERELAIAHEIQQTILPANTDEIDGLEIAAAYFPMGEVGGDFYDVVKLDQHRCVLVLGDVSSHGVPAALVMSAASGIIKTLLSEHRDITVSNLVTRLNDLLTSEIIKEREMFVTLFICVVDLKKQCLTYCRAGHLPGLFWDHQTRSISELAVGGPIVGQFGGVEFQQGECELRSGDRLFLFTDGLTEAADEDNNLFGRERAEQVLSMESELSPKDFCTKVKEWVDRFSEGSAEETHDDFTILQLRVK